MIEEAKLFAQKAHINQKYGMYPYTYHLESVASIVKSYGEEAQVLAYLHDTVEDTEITIDQIKDEFGEFIANCIFYLTDEPGLTRTERKTNTYNKIRNISAEFNLIFIVKAADRMANMRMCLIEQNFRIIDIYIAEYTMFKENIYIKDLCEEIWVELNNIYDSLIMLKNY